MALTFGRMDAAGRRRSLRPNVSAAQPQEAVPHRLACVPHADNRPLKLGRAWPYSFGRQSTLPEVVFVGDLHAAAMRGKYMRTPAPPAGYVSARAAVAKLGQLCRFSRARRDYWPLHACCGRFDLAPSPGKIGSWRPDASSIAGIDATLSLPMRLAGQRVSRFRCLFLLRRMPPPCRHCIRGYLPCSARLVPWRC